MPAAGPVRPTGRPRPTGRAIPEPAAMAGGTAPGAPAPSLADASAGGGDSTESETTCAPRTMVRPKVLFSSVSTSGTEAAAPGAALVFVALRLTRLNSSVSARTRFICYARSAFCPGMHHGRPTNLVKSQHLPDHLAPIVHGDLHPVVDEAGLGVKWTLACPVNKRSQTARRERMRLTIFPCLFAILKLEERSCDFSWVFKDCECEAAVASIWRPELCDGSIEWLSSANCGSASSPSNLHQPLARIGP